MITSILNRDFRRDLRLFAFFVGNEALFDGEEEFDEVEYVDLLIRPGDTLGQLFAVYLNNARLQLQGEQPMSSRQPEERATQWMLAQCLDHYRIIPPLAPWELIIDDSASDAIGVIQAFALTLGRGELEPSLLGRIDYVSHLCDGGSLLEMLFALFCNVLRLDAQQRVVNQAYALQRAAHYLRHELDPSFRVIPPFAPWEIELFL